MNISYEWLKDFTEFSYTPKELAELITSRAVTVDDVVSLREDLKDIIVGRVIEARPHSDSDHLWLTQVDAGGPELLDVVCGAPNVVPGTLYPFAPVGATLPGGLKIERRKIRGQSSNGMLCSARELGLGGDHAGIMALDVEVAPGSRFLNALPIGDTQLVLDVGANRADLLSHYGVAREVAAVTGKPLKRPEISGAVEVPYCKMVDHEGMIGAVQVRVEDPQACPLYIAVAIRGVTIGSSPEWLIKRLEGAGVRSINNVVDATNYMLHGFGQPMHAFDLGKMKDSTVVVRKAYPKEKLITLDGVERTLDTSMTVIADAERAQAIAGVIGGQNSEVDDLTKDILLEVAIFDPKNIRATRRTIGVSTDASYRFERAMDIVAPYALAQYAAQLIMSLAGGTLEGTPVAVQLSYPSLESGVSVLTNMKAPTLYLRHSRVTQVLGEAVPAAECTALLRSIGCSVDESDRDELAVITPSWRSDLTHEIDLVEEVARLRGYNSFSSELRPFRLGTVPDAPSYVTTKRVTEALVAAGLYEIRPIPFVADAGEQGVRLRNPLAENEGMLRSNLLSTLSRRAEYNFAHMVRNIRLFEVGVAFTQGSEPGTLPTERTVAAAIITGDQFPQHFTNSKPPQTDLWDAKALAQLIGDAAYGAGCLTLVPSTTHDSWTAEVEGVQVGTVGLVTLDAPVWASPAYGIEIDVTPAFSAQRRVSRYQPLPTTPAAEFDLALLVPENVAAALVEETIRDAAGELLESLTVFDEFRGKGIDAGARSVAWRLTLRHPDRTLRDKEIEGRRDKILRTLDKEIGVRQRTS